MKYQEARCRRRKQNREEREEANRNKLKEHSLAICYKQTMGRVEEGIDCCLVRLSCKIVI